MNECSTIQLMKKHSIDLIEYRGLRRTLKEVEVVVFKVVFEEEDEDLENVEDIMFGSTMKNLVMQRSSVQNP